jgi:hypothetical protein
MNSKHLHPMHNSHARCQHMGTIYEESPEEGQKELEHGAG